MAPEAFTAYDEALLRVVRDELGRGDRPIVTMMTDPITVLPYGVPNRADPAARTGVCSLQVWLRCCPRDSIGPRAAAPQS